MTYETWIWAELLAFDNASADQGVSAYLERLGFVPTGISLMASASDFIVLHEPLDVERPLFPDVCTRFGHAGNEERARQDWSNWQLRALVRHLRARGVAVFVSVFAAYHHDRFHREWLSAHPEARIVYAHLGLTDGVSMLARLDDGTYYEDLFVSQLVRVVQDYGFDGFHGPDCLGPGGSLGHSDCSDGITAQFADFLGTHCPPGLERVSGHEVSRLQQRMDLIWTRLRCEWIEFNLQRWEAFWGKIVRALRPLGIPTMINSGNTKAAFESMYIYGMDYRRVARLGVDYLVVETVAANLALINGGYERHFDFAATLAEMKALVPAMKVIFLHGVKDVVESYDLLRHAPARLEREFFTLANQYIQGASGVLERCATGFMVCLGDGLAVTEWQYLRRQWQAGYAFTPVRAGELTWLWSEAALDGLLTDYPRHGTWPGYGQVAHLVEFGGLQIHSICRAEHLGRAAGPLLVPNADLIPASLRRELEAYRGGPVVLLGRVPEGGFGAAVSVVTCRISADYLMGCAVLHGELAPSTLAVPASSGAAFADSRPPCFFSERPAYMPIPAEFWTQAAAVIRGNVEAWQERHRVPGCRAQNPQDGLRALTLEDQTGILRTALISCGPTYLVPQYCFTAPPTTVAKVSGFPYTPLVVVEDSIRSGHNSSPLHIPPYGIVVMDVGFAPPRDPAAG
jgi:hypothetical protein